MLANDLELTRFYDIHALMLCSTKIKISGYDIRHPFNFLDRSGTGQ